MSPAGIRPSWGTISVGLHLLLALLVRGLGRPAPDVPALQGAASGMFAAQVIQLQLLSSKPPSPSLTRSRSLAAQPALPKISAGNSPNDSATESGPGPDVGADPAAGEALASSPRESGAPGPQHLSLETWRVEYPHWASQARVGGPVRLRVQLGDRGHIEGYEVLQSPHPSFVEAVLRSLRSLPPVPKGLYELLVDFKGPAGP